MNLHLDAPMEITPSNQMSTSNYPRSSRKTPILPSFLELLTGLLKACPPAGQFSAAPYPCYSSGSFLAYYFQIRNRRSRKRREKALLLNGVHTPFLGKREVAMASRRLSADTPRRRTSSGSPGKGTSEEAFTSQGASSSRGGPMQIPMLHTRKRSRIAVKSDDSS